MKIIPLQDVCFFEELPALLGISREYARKLCCPPTTDSGAWYREQKFPDPFHVSPSGVRVWFVKDVRIWALGLRSKRTGLRKMKGIPLLDVPAEVSERLGLR